MTACSDPRFNVPVGQTVVGINSVYFRPTEVDLLIGDPTKANTQLGWLPEYTLQEMVAEMIQNDLSIFA